MGNDLLGVSVTGLRVSQTALRTVGHNIANSGTEGYSRQRVEPVTNPAILQAGGYIGNGVNVNSIERIVNGFITEQVRTDNTLFNDLETFFDEVSQLDNLLSDESTGLSGSLNSFFSAMQNGADDPTSIPARQLIISEGENLADRFNSIYTRLQVIEEGVNNGMEVAVSQINALASNIAQLNVKISDAQGLGENVNPNDLMDQRDTALKELSALVPLQVFDQGNGQVNVVIGTGQTLVIGPDARKLSLASSAQDASKNDVWFNNANNLEAITKVISGGELGGLIRFRDDVLDSTYNQLGRIGIVLADQFNEIHQKGLDLDNEFGGLFFFDVNQAEIARTRVIGDSNNALPNDRVLSLNIQDSSQLSTNDYRLSLNQGGVYRITNLSSGEEIATGLLPGQLPTSIEFEGLELVFEQGSFQPGDSFVIKPTRTAAQEFSTAIESAEDIAFASPLLTDADLGNLGTGKISAGEVLSLEGLNGEELPLFANSGEMNPPMVVVFNTPTSYDILDNSDPGNPVQLEPPIRDQRFVPGVNNHLFSELEGITQVSTNGDMVGLPEGRRPVTQAVLLPGTSAPDYTVSDFSGAGDQFSFDLVVNNTLAGANDGTFTVTVNGAALSDDQALILNINSQLGTSDVVAFMADDGTVAFRLNTAGYGNIDIQNYNADPDGGGNNAPAGQANNLLGFDIESSTFSTDGDADGYEGVGTLTNGYPAEAIQVAYPSNIPGQNITTNVFTRINASARETASELNNLPGVSANAFTYAELSDLQITFDEPLQIELNGERLIEYGLESSTGLPRIGPMVPNPNNFPDEFYDYLAEQINANENLQALGISATPGRDSYSGERELRIFSTEGDDLDFSLIATDGDTVNISDGENSPVTLSGVGNSVRSQVVVGGRMDISMEEGISLSSFPPNSMLFGDTGADDFALSAYRGIQAYISGTPSTGDRFTLDFNEDAALDNRNALSLTDLQDKKSLNGGNATLGAAYGTLVEVIGIETNSAKINRDAAEQVLQQSEDLRNSISGVNLDEEAADLIRFEQLFSANAQVISVARETFDRLLSSF